MKKLVDSLLRHADSFKRERLMCLRGFVYRRRQAKTVDGLRRPNSTPGRTRWLGDQHPSNKRCPGGVLRL